ncbi:alpha/beta fold hydrolase [Pseudaeromonas paramecii]|uniref:Alpha/beta fold hydrolase n=1 Tax=Pseudaeromonas paramecii TaxID=2138166 RepID=A0ABP8Q8D8_9GAMM
MQLHTQFCPGDPARVVVLIHGLFGSLDNLGQLAKALGEAGFAVLTLDLRNHGRSPHSAEHSYPAMVADLLELLDEQGLSRVMLLGHSMGGKVAMQFALHHPERVQKLVVVDMAPADYQPGEHDAVFAGLEAVAAQAPLTRSEADACLSQHLPDPAVRQFLLKSFLPGTRPGWRFNLPVLRTDYPQILAWPPVEGRYSGPSLFIKGELSAYLQPKHQDTIQRLFPQAKAKLVLGAGHWPHAEKPLLFNKLVVDFLSASS